MICPFAWASGDCRRFASCPQIRTDVLQICQICSILSIKTCMIMYNYTYVYTYVYMSKSLTYLSYRVTSVFQPSAVVDWKPKI